jgi:AraC family transcriptional regulator of adaptative response / DNA-3-methyladenine glycosylase II
LAKNNVTYELAAAAEAAGFRACLRCRPYRVAGPIGSDAPDLVCEAVQLIINGELDRGTEAELADRVGVSARHLRRLFLTHLGASPDQLARSRRAHFARRMLDDTELTVLDVAFASGFGSLRQFNRTMREVFRASPSELRDRRRRTDRLTADGGLALRLPIVPGYDWAAIRDFFAARAIPGVEAVDRDTYRRTITVDGAPGLVEVSPGDAENLILRVHLPYWEGLIHVVGRIGQMLGAEMSIGKHSGPGSWSAIEAGVRAILSEPEQLEKLVTSLGTAVPGLPGGLTHAFPDADRLTASNLAAIGIPQADEIAALAERRFNSGFG